MTVSDPGAGQQRRSKTPLNGEERRYTATHGQSSVGRSEVHITCPFCSTSVTAYLWSLAGSGKRCTCGVKFTCYGLAVAR